MQAIWVLVNCNTKEEAINIGDNILKQRLGSCYDIFPRELTKYFWPPKSGKIETAKGVLIIVETLKVKYAKLHSTVKKMHGDELPFIGYIDIKGSEDSYNKWIEGELLK